jgi:glycosyltransferase involved in cell wall biosynthesis
MRRIHYFPLERLEHRYTTHLDDSITEHLMRKYDASSVYRYYPELNGRETSPPPPGCFLNAGATCEFKAAQLALLSRAYAEGEVSSGDLLFFSDLWFPGIEMVRYLDHFHGKRTEVRGLLHAGSFTDTDEVRKLERWAAPLENAWLDIADRVFVGSEFMRHDLLQKRSVAPGKVHATGFPLDPLVKVQPRRGKRALVVFTGRDHPEKQPHLWQQLKRSFSSGVEFVWTMENGGLSRSDYLELLSHARVIVSFALQENFGFALREAAALGCVPIVPDRLVYPECFADPYRYKTFSDCVWKVNDALKDKLVPPFVDDREFEVPGAWFA